VEPGTVVVDVSKQKATFNIKDKNQFNLEQIDEAVKEQKFRGCELLSGPDDPKKNRDKT
jgi:hypothetical protein